MYRYFQTAFFTAILILFYGECIGQLPDYQIKILTEQQGLQPAEFIDMARDSQGFLWLLSPTKAQRYDGQRSWSFPVPAYVNSVFVDQQNQTWLLARHHVYRFINNYKGFHKVLELGDTAYVVCLFYSHQQLHLMLSNACMVFDQRLQQFVAQRKLVLPSHKRFTTVYAYNEDHLFVASTDSVYSIHLYNYDWKSTPFKRIASLIALSGNQVLVSNSQLKSFVLQPGNPEAQEIRAAQFEPELQSDFIRLYGGIPLGKNIFQLSTSEGLFHYDAATSRFVEPVFYHRGEKLANTSSARALYRDAEGTVYMTMADGVAFYKPEARDIKYIRNYQFGNISLPDADIRSFAEDNDGNLWIATINGIARLNETTGQLTTFLAGDENSISYPSIRHLLFCNNILWVGTGGEGVWAYNPAKSGFEQLTDDTDTMTSGLNKEYIWRLVPLQNGEVFVAGGGFCYVINKNKHVRRLDKEAFIGISRTAIQDSSGRIWHGTANGLNCTNADFRLLFRLDTVFPDKRIAAFSEWKKGRMLIGTLGLFEVECNNEGVVAVRQCRGFPADRFVYAMEKDATGNIWLGTDDGLYRYDPFTDQSQSFGLAENVQMQAFNSNAIYRASSGMMYAGGKSGMNYFDPRHMDMSTMHLKPVIVAFRIADDDSTFFNSVSPYDIPYFHRSISVEVSVPDFTRQYDLQYQYKTRPDEEWIANGKSRFIQLHHYRPGHYKLTVAASHDGYQWYESNPILFNIQPPWWQRWYVVLSFAILLCVVSYEVFQSIRRRNYRRKQQAVIDYFAKSTYGDNDVDLILWDIAMNCISRLGFEECVIYLVDTDRHVMVQKAAYGPKSQRQFELMDPMEIPIGSGITGAVAKTGKAEIINDTSKDPRYLVDDEARKSEITVPIIHEGNVIGVIDSENNRKGFFTAEQLQTLTTIAGICAVKIARCLSAVEMKKVEAKVEEINNRMMETRYQNLRLQMKMQEINTRLMETRYQNLRLQMNPHFLFNCLSSIQHLVVSQQTTEAYTYMSVFSHFLRSILQYADNNVITLEEEMKMIEMYVKLERLGSDKAFTFILDVDESLEIEDVLIPPLLVQPIIENAIWHGLMPKEGEKVLSVQFTNIEDHAMACIIDDNGIGRHAIQPETKQINGFTHESKALNLINERLQLLEQKTGKPAHMETEDKYEMGLPAGTRVTISLPFLNPGDI